MLLRARATIGSALGLVLACAPAPESDADEAAAPVLAEITDLDPDPGRLRAILVAEPAVLDYLPAGPAAVWAYRDGGDPDAVARVPGPLVRVARGTMIEIELRNALPVETTIHWHGLRVPATQDGTPSAQVPVPPGGSFTYRFEARDAGTFWFHPHVDAATQIERGLYGALVVEDDVASAEDFEADRVFVLDDVKLEADGTLSSTTDALDLMLGRQGNVLLVDGVRRPTLQAGAGTRERWRFVNAANGRYFRLRLQGARWLELASDGGPLPAARELDTVLLVPGERRELAVELPAAPDTALLLETLHTDRGHDVPDPGPLPLMDVVLQDPGESAPPLVWVGPDIAPLPVPGPASTRTLVLSEDDEDASDPRFYIDGLAFPETLPIMVPAGTVERWRVRNDAQMDHPLHVHGLFFQTLDPSGVPDVAAGWKDTINIPRDASVELVARFDNIGQWMVHCHILEHAERGMMTMLHVMP
ncbi:MAG: multicopper oxidase family protein [Nannocystaceae bacterium]|nr:multicopper oxidase family protein [Nannocystaceae bacterium]